MIEIRPPKKIIRKMKGSRKYKDENCAKPIKVLSTAKSKTTRKDWGWLKRMVQWIKGLIQ